MEWFQLPLGPMQTNAYILYNDHKECLIIDPGEEPEKIKQFISKKELNPVAILLTHAHFDHIGALEAIRSHYKIDVYMHIQEKSWLQDPDKNGSGLFQGITPITASPAENLWEREESSQIGNFRFELMHTPGHSPGSISFYFRESSILISGDVLFKGSIGRTDLPGGNMDILMQSIKKLLTLDSHTYVLSGHGPVTTLSDENRQNPFLQ
ncbi:MBL fold metallo-hydrolase [Jeotgalibacillus terrae]|uniref:MBL fold metallo-hydrolase n=1 Tax=Jeotgalibacillus terrae TaxID=587735 RepID=A0ABW5ZJW9_9BACL|nr:MBL fold metallo-hydrolase [Jeotgalibacillus terrae]MBM7577582.1 glyoxylase-like metal-dependent hydrolase (beta-lactamase superfamily II) [Jeotgalibacillus terrae]